VVEVSFFIEPRFYGFLSGCKAHGLIPTQMWGYIATNLYTNPSPWPSTADYNSVIWYNQ